MRTTRSHLSQDHICRRLCASASVPVESGRRHTDPWEAYCWHCGRYIENIKSKAIYGADSLEERRGELVSCTCSEQERIDLKSNRLLKKSLEH